MNDNSARGICKTCDGNRMLTFARGDFAKAELCPDCASKCPRCDNEGYLFRRDDQGYSYVEDCPACTGLKKRIELFNRARLPARYHNKGFLDFRTYFDQGRTRPRGNLVQIHSRLYQYALNFMPGDRGLLMVGKVGTGKTHLLAALLRQLTLKAGIQCRFVEFTHLLSELREAYENKDNTSDLLNALSSVPVLAIDELGKGRRRNDWQLSVIDELISKRYNKGLTTFFTSNYLARNPTQTIKPSHGPVDTSKLDFRRKVEVEDLEDRLDQRIVSRLYEMTHMVELKDVPDYRKR